MSEEEVTELLRIGMQKYADGMTEEEAIQFLSQLYSYDGNGQLKEKFEYD